MSHHYTGGCACAAIRYEAVGEPLVSVECQCRDCSRESGTGHSSHLVFLRTNVNISGKAKEWATTGVSGEAKKRGFCPDCGAPIYSLFDVNPNIITLRAASLDEPSRYTPSLIAYRDSSFAWDAINPALPAFAKMPPQ